MKVFDVNTMRTVALYTHWLLSYQMCHLGDFPTTGNSAVSSCWKVRPLNGITDGNLSILSTGIFWCTPSAILEMAHIFLPSNLLQTKNHHPFVVALFVMSRPPQDQARWLQKRKQMNDERRAAGEDPLPDEESQFDKKVICSNDSSSKETHEVHACLPEPTRSIASVFSTGRAMECCTVLPFF